jgi:hypothetical protein
MSIRLGESLYSSQATWFFSVVYLGFAIASSQAVVVAAFYYNGVYTAMIVGVERRISPKYRQWN